MVIYVSLVDGCRGLWNQLCAAHGLPIPVGSVVNGEFGALLRCGVGGVFEGWREIDIGCDGGRAVDVVLVRTNLTGP